MLGQSGSIYFWDCTVFFKPFSRVRTVIPSDASAESSKEHFAHLKQRSARRVLLLDRQYLYRVIQHPLEPRAGRRQAFDPVLPDPTIFLDPNSMIAEGWEDLVQFDHDFSDYVPPE